MTKLHAADTPIKTCLITGGNGYLGKYISDYLIDQDYQVSTLGRSNNNTYSCDISVDVPALKENYNVVIHCAGKAHSFPRTPKEEDAFFEVNVNGTQNLLKALENAPTLPKHFVFMSSVSVYGINEGLLVKENTPLLSKYPYGRSKIKAEQLITSWCEQHQVTCLILRLPLLAGKNPPGNLKMMIKGIANGYYFNISDGAIRRSIVMADDVARIIPKALTIGGTYNLSDGHHPSFRELANLMAKQLNKTPPQTIPNWLSKVLGLAASKLGFISPINAYKFEKLTSTLTFDDSKARKVIGWSPSKVIDNFRIK